MGETEEETIGCYIYLEMSTEIIIFDVFSNIRYIIPGFKVEPSLYKLEEVVGTPGLFRNQSKLSRYLE